MSQQQNTDERSFAVLFLPEFLQIHIPKKKHMLAIVLHHHLSEQQSPFQMKTMSIYLPVKNLELKYHSHYIPNHLYPLT